MTITVLHAPPASRVPLSKRALDLAITLPLLVVLSPLLLSIALAIKLTSRGPVLFQQTARRAR